MKTFDNAHTLYRVTSPRREVATFVEKKRRFFPSNTILYKEKIRQNKTKISCLIIYGWMMKE